MMFSNVVLLGIFGLLLLLDCRLDQAPYDCSMEGRLALLFDGGARRSVRTADRAIVFGGSTKELQPVLPLGIDLEMFLKPTPCQTMACLDHRGLVDLKVPE
jgi:hypothetical protein